MISINDFAALEKCKGNVLGTSDWWKVDQEAIDNFAKVTGDFQWIHLDADRCARESPFKKTIAHGYLILSLIPKFFYQIIEFPQADLTINYGLDKVRFTHPVAVNSRVRALFKLSDLVEIPGGVRIYSHATFEIENFEKPACIAEPILQVVW